MPVAGGVPNVQTLENIDYVIGHLPAWRGRRRVRVLEACARRLTIMRQAQVIDVATLKAYRQKVLPRLTKARRQAQPIQPLPREELVIHEEPAAEDASE